MSYIRCTSNPEGLYVYSDGKILHWSIGFKTIGIPEKIFFKFAFLKLLKHYYNMGRVFEKRKYKMFARYDKMAKGFTRIGKEIVIAVKASGPDPDSNPALRRCYQNARSAGMPKDRVEAAIKRAMGKDTSNYEEILYEGYAPHGVALLVETATDNHVRTVANVKSHFNKGHGSLGNSGSVSFQFKKMGVFNLKPEGLNMDDLELDLIDHGLDELGESNEIGRASCRERVSSPV